MKLSILRGIIPLKRFGALLSYEVPTVKVLDKDVFAEIGVSMSASPDLITRNKSDFIVRRKQCCKTEYD
jgi:hypothetical protein